MSSLNSRYERGETVLPAMIGEMWKRRDEWRSEEGKAERLDILQKFVSQDLQQTIEDSKDERHSGYFHPSSANRCLRQQWFSKMDAEEDVEYDVEGEFISNRRFDTGDHLHLAYGVMLEWLGMLVEREVPFIRPKDKMKGRADAIVEVEGRNYLVDFKSSISHMYNEFQKNDYPGDNYVLQLQIYLEALGKKYNIEKGIILVEDKDKHKTCEYIIDYDPAAFQYALDRKKTLFDAVNNLEIPEKEGKSMQRPPCRWCPYTETCYGSAVRIKQIIENNSIKRKHNDGESIFKNLKKKKTKTVECS